jgi:hypothetical protein
MALAKSFLFNANRANRVCLKNKASLAIDRDERERFLSATKPLVYCGRPFAGVQR